MDWVGHAPNGNVYYFDHLLTSQLDTVNHPYKMFTRTNQVGIQLVTTAFPELLPRNIYVLYVSKIEDRFGNWVKYEWAGPKLNRIYSNDGREMVITSDKAIPDVPESVDMYYEVKQVSAGARHWLYGRTPETATSQVTNPDGSKWIYSGAVPGSTAIRYQRLSCVFGDGSVSNSADPGDEDANGVDPNTGCVWVSAVRVIESCVQAYDFEPGQTQTYSVTHPAGVKATYQFVPTRHGRANMPYSCNQPRDDPKTWNTRVPHFEDIWTLTEKSVSGPGIAPISTNYSYSCEGLPSCESISFDETTSNWLGGPGSYGGPQRKLVTLARSDGTSRQYVFGRDFGDFNSNGNEGLLLEQKELNQQQQVVRTTTSTWVGPGENANQAFALSFGSALTG